MIVTNIAAMVAAVLLGFLALRLLLIIALGTIDDYLRRRSR